MNKATVEIVCRELARIDGYLFERQYVIGKLIMAEVGTDLKPGNGKGEPSHHGRKGFKREGGLMTVCTELAKVCAKRGRSAAWFKYCYYYAKAFTPAQFVALAKSNPTQNALQAMCFLPPDEIDEKIAGGDAGADPRSRKRLRNKDGIDVDAIDHGTEYGSQIEWDQVEYIFENILTRWRDRAAEIKAKFDAALERARKVRG